MNTLLTIQFYESMTNILTREISPSMILDMTNVKKKKKNKKIG